MYACIYAYKYGLTERKMPQQKNKEKNTKPKWIKICQKNSTMAFIYIYIYILILFCFKSFVNVCIFRLKIKPNFSGFLFRCCMKAWNVLANDCDDDDGDDWVWYYMCVCVWLRHDFYVIRYNVFLRLQSHALNIYKARYQKKIFIKYRLM